MSRAGEAVAMLRGGADVVEVAAETGYSERHVQRLRRERLGAGRAHALEGERLAIALELAADRCPISEIARTVGVSRESVRLVVGPVLSTEEGIAARELLRRFEEVTW